MEIPFLLSPRWCSEHRADSALDKLPMSLIRDGQDVNGLKKHQAKMTIETAPFAEVFGPKASRKRVKLNVSTIEDLAGDAEKSLEKYHDRLEGLKLLSGNSGIDAEGAEAVPAEEDFSVALAKEPIFRCVNFLTPQASKTTD